MRIRQTEFSGVAPKVHPRNLPETMAQIATNVRFDRRQLEPFYGLTLTTTNVPLISNNPIKGSVFLYEDTYWLFSLRDTDFVEAPLAYDPFKYLIIVDGISNPKILRNDMIDVNTPYPGGPGYDLNLPTAPDGVVATVTGVVPGGAETSDLDLIRSTYVYTLVDDWGRESQPCSPSNTVEYYPEHQDVSLSFPALPTGDFNFGAASKKRIYRTNSGTTGGVFQYVGETPLGATTFVDNVDSEDLGEEIPSITWDPAPDTNTAINIGGPLHSLVAMPNNFLAGVTANEVCFSEQGVFHAWPVDYRTAIKKYTIVGIAVMGEGLFIGTTGTPHIAYGNSPASMTVAPLNSNQACVSKRSIVNVDGAIMYASPDGMCVVNGTSVNVVTEELFTKDEWLELEPESIEGYYFEGSYVGFCNLGGFIFDIRGGKNAWSWVEWGDICGGYSDTKRDSLYLLRDIPSSGQFELVKVDPEAPRLALQWKSRRHKLPQEINFGLIQVTADAYPVTVTLTAYDFFGNEYPQTIQITSRYAQYLQSGFLACEWEYQIDTANIVYDITLAQTFEEIE